MKDRRTMMELLRPAGCGWGEGGEGARTEIADPHAANFLSLVTSGLHRFVELCYNLTDTQMQQQALTTRARRLKSS